MKDTFCGVRFKEMVFFSLFMMITFSLSSTADFILAARLFGDNAMAAVNLVTPIFFVIAFLSSMIGTGTAYIYSFEIGAFRQENANKFVGQGAILAVTSSILLTLILFFGREVFFSFFDVTGDIEIFAREYYSYFFLSAAINPIYFLMYVIVYADGGGKNGVVANFLSFFVNVVSSIILGMKFGISGIALGTFLGYLSAMVVFAKWIFFDSQTLKPILNFSPSKILKVFKLSYVHASFYIYVGLGNIILNAFFLKTFGEQNFPVLSVVMSFLQFSQFLLGVAEAAEPLVNIYLGEKNFDGIKKVMKIAIKAAVSFGAVLIPIIFLFAANIAELFGIKDELLAESVFALRIISFSMPFLAILYLFATYYQICGHGRIALSLSLCKDLVLYVGLPIIFSLALGIKGIWLGMMLVSMITCALFIIFLRIRHGKSFPLLLNAADIVSRDEKLNLERVLELRDWAEAEFSKRGFDGKISMKAALIVEEIGMSIVDNNPNTPPLSELTLFFLTNNRKLSFATTEFTLI